MSQEERITALEEQIAFLQRTVDELSDVVARQEKDLELTMRRLHLLMEAEAARQADSEGTVALADQRPPHW